ncbi:MAG: hypothetical protein M1827_007164 [Pycnora praestabilis]|nr:MAG: hypothetical protein M1827_007164 [Pycnora praestabilis]
MDTSYQRVPLDVVPKTNQKIEQHAWTPGFFNRLPWNGVLALTAVICCAIASAVILVVSDGQPLSNWTVQPTVWLALVSAVGNSMIVFALQEGVRIAWWRKALKGGTINDLHRQWDFGHSLFASVFAGTHFNVVALASIAATLIVVDGPLFQRASTVVNQNVTTSVSLSAQVAQTFPTEYYTGIVTGRVTQVSVMAPDFAQVIQDFSLRTPMKPDISGCQGTCFTTIRAMGLSANCSVNVTSIDYGAELNEQPLPNGSFPEDFFDAHTTFAVDVSNEFLGGYDAADNTSATILMTITYSNTTGNGDSCPGDLLINTCDLAPAIVEYPIMIHNGTVTLQSTENPKYAVASLETVADTGHGEVHLGGIQLAAYNQYASTASVAFGGGVGWIVEMMGSLPSQYVELDASNWQDTGCNYTFQDPTNDLLASMNEIMFRTAISAANYPNQTSPKNQTLPATQILSETVFQSHFRFLGGAMAVMFVVVCIISITFYGWWELGRNVTLDPIVTAKAFNAPLLYGSTSNASVKQLLRDVGNREVKYGEVMIYGDKQTLMPGDEGRVVGARRLELANPGMVLPPRKGTRYDS